MSIFEFHAAYSQLPTVTRELVVLAIIFHEYLTIIYSISKNNDCSAFLLCLWNMSDVAFGQRFLFFVHVPAWDKDFILSATKCARKVRQTITKLFCCLAK